VNLVLKQEQLIINNKIFIKTYSNENKYIFGGSPEGLYTEAIDPAELNRTYEETNQEIEEVQE